MNAQSRRVVRVALISHLAAALFKLITGLISGSAVLLIEALHSLLDALNQSVLFRGQASRRAAGAHIYVYSPGKAGYLVNLWSSVGLFSIGCGLGLAWGIYALVSATRGAPLLDPSASHWSLLLAVLGALLIQSYSFFLAARTYLEQLREQHEPRLIGHLFDGGDVTLSVIVIQSLAGLAGLLLAAAGVVTTLVSGNPIWDGLAALCIALLMGATAMLLGYVYLRYLTDVRDRQAETVLRDLVAERRTLHLCDSVRSMILDDHRTVLFADIEVGQDSMVSGMLAHINATKKELLARVPESARGESRTLAFVTARATVESTMRRVEVIVTELEQSVRERVPQVAEVSIRVRGISGFELPKAPVRKPLETQEAVIMGRASAGTGVAGP